MEDCYKKGFSDLELNKIKEKSMGVTEGPDENGCKGSVKFGEKYNVVCENERHVVLQDTFLNQDRYNNNDEREVRTKLALKHSTVLQKDEN